MKKVFFLPLMLTLACNDSSQEEIKRTVIFDSISIRPEIPLVDPFKVVDTVQPIVDTITQDTTVYENDRFREVRVKRLDTDLFEISGEAQVFEGNFNWTLEDGHRVLKQGHEPTSAGAPEFGEFNFRLIAAKRDSNSTLHLILFESSAKNGKRQHELPIPLY